jgi:hypothetical protein
MAKKTIEKKCLYCKKQITVYLYDHNRGYGKFCNKKCSSSYNNEKRSKIILSCVVCGSGFKTKSNHAKYCSNKCRRKVSCQLSKDRRSEGKDRYHLAEKVRKIFGELACFVCGWKESSCDVHHIIPKRDRGSDALSNLTILCPNHHRLADRGDLRTTKTLADIKKTDSVK